MAVDLDHSFSTERTIDDSFATILDLERVIPCVEGATVLERTGPEAVRAAKQLARRALSNDETARTIAERRSSSEGQEGLSAFIERRAPGWLPQPGDESAST